ncbi:MAG: cbb3-type cytochrome c oxidase subunit I [Betaproteobacteria bacterium]|nr:cbb3-type cytochrome c oxidase subunit I [Betaproteobacteria bacterium]
MDNGWVQVIPEGVSRRLATAWLVLGVAALGASSLFAVLLVLSRAPYVGRWLPGHDFFHGALALHVDLSVLIWFLAFTAALWSARSIGRGGAVSWLGLALAAAGAVLVMAAPFAGPWTAMSSNYVPVLHSTAFLAGLALFAAGFFLALLRTLVSGWRWLRSDAEDRASGAGLYAAALAATLAFGSFAAAYAQLPRGLHMGAYYELLFWGPGHTLQFAYTLLMLAAWMMLARAGGAPIPLGSRLQIAALALAFAPALAIPALHAAYPVASQEFRDGFTQLMRWGSWPVPLVMGAAILAGLRRNPVAAPEARSLRVALILSMILFAAGAVIGALIREDNAMVPAHYHGAIGAVTLAFMGLTLHLLPALGLDLPAQRIVRWQPYAYGGGTLVMALALAWSGSQGVARKVPGSAQLLDTVQEVAGMALMGLAGAVAIAGSLAFVALVARALTSAVALRGVSEAAPAPGRRRRVDRRPLAIGLTAALIAAIGAMVSLLPGAGSRDSVVLTAPLPDARVRPGAHAREAKRAEIADRFQQAVAMLHARQYQHAVAALHRVLELDPLLPEAHVNMGYAMIGLERYKVAKDFFESATELRPTQANAYYGLALAHEALGELPLAIGAMRTYLHLTPPEDPYVRKGQTALWEWENRKDLERFNRSGKSERLPGNGKK